MKILSRGRSVALGLTLIAAGLAAPPVLGSPAGAAPQPDPTIVDSIRDEAKGTVAVRANPATGKVGFLRATTARGDLLPGVAADNRAEAVEKASRYIDEYAAAFGASASQLEQAGVLADDFGWSITYTQSHRGIPVFAGVLKAHVDKAGQLTSVNGFVAPDAAVSTSPRITEDAAATRALGVVRSRPSGHEDAMPDVAADSLEVRSNELMIYRTGSTRGIDGDSRLAWVVEVWNRSTIRETVIVDAQTGKHLNRWSMMAHALDRELYEGSYDPEDLVWSEGDDFPDGLDEDQQNEILGTGEAYWLFMNTFGYDAWDGEGGKMITVNNDPTIDCPNANWNGVTTNYCTGVTGDDTVAHEWAHAYTESTSGLIYQWQSGAMNEAYSDIWGETVDMLNDRHNEGGETPDDTVLREPGKCSIYQPAAYELGVTIDAPESIAGPCESAPAAFGPEIEGTQTVQVVVAQDEEGEGDTAVNGCSTTYTNAAEVAGNWVYVERGGCTFQEKADNAVANGAVGIVVGNNQDGLISMSGVSTIPGFMITQERGDAIESVEGPVTMTIERLEDARATDDTYRWLSGETDPAFGGAIRDMWNPNCFGDPGKVSDAEYHCTSDDSGGVHTNSGVVNRLFAILVDGFEPAGVDAIGLDQAANLFWHTQTNHLTPVSGFDELADGLEASCATLTGQDINELTLGNPTEPDGSDGQATPELADPITAADCVELTAAIGEVELRKEPVQCNFQPLLRKGTVSCGEGTESVTTWSEDFEDGLAGWTQDHEFGDYSGIGFPELTGAVHHPWETTTDLPRTTDLPGNAGEHPASTVAYAPDPTTGSCAGDAEDESSRNGLISPELTVPEGFEPRLSFEHLVATEALWDGGNVKYSTDGGETFAEVPAEAWLFNGPKGHLETAAAGNSNPLAGQTAFTGTDGGESTGSWGTSVIGLKDLGLRPGDTVQFRFDLGRDGCNGVDGWYVDNVEVTICEEVSEPEQAPTTTKVVSVKPEPVQKGKAFRVKVKVTSPDGTPKGKVVLRKKGGAELGSARLDDGVATIKVTRSLRLGKHKLVASYLGNARFEDSRTTVTVRVVR